MSSFPTLDQAAIERGADRFLQGLSPDERMRVGICAMQSVGIVESIPWVKDWLRDDQVAQVAFLAAVNFPFNTVYAKFPRHFRLTPATLLAAYAVAAVRIASESSDVAGRGYGLELARRAIAMAYALDEADPKAVVTLQAQLAAAARHALGKKLRAFVATQYQTANFRSRLSAAGRIAPKAKKYADEIGMKISEGNLKRTIYGWLLADFPREK